MPLLVETPRVVGGADIDVLRIAAELTVADAGVPVATVGTRLKRARTELKEILSEDLRPEDGG